MTKVAVSVLGADFSQADKWLQEIEEARTDMLQWDIMDGKFVPNTGVEIKRIEELRPKTRIFFDCHLMVEKPEKYFEELYKNDVESITFHIEAAKDPLKTIKEIRDFGLGAGIAVNAKTKAEKIIPFLHHFDIALVMSVNAGFGGQKFIESALEKIRAIEKAIKKEDMLCEIQVDGGINLQTGKQAVDAGADILVAGSYVFGHEKGLKEAVLGLKKL